MSRTNSRNNKAFDTTYAGAPQFYPDQVRIIGGADLPDKRERGPLDTHAADVWKTVDGQPITWAQHPLYSKARLEQGLDPGIVKSIDLVGVIQSPVIVKIEGVPTVNAGRGRTRSARICNYERKKRCGQLGKSDADAAEACARADLELIRIDYTHKRMTESTDLLARMIAENHARQDDDLATTIELAARFHERCNNTAMVAAVFNTDEQTVRLWLGFFDVATDETKQAVKDGKLSITAGAQLARVKDHAEQNALLADLLSGKVKPTVREAAKRARKDRGRAANPFARKAELVKFQTFVSEARPRGDFYDGVKALLELQTTGQTADKRLAKLFKDFGS